MTTTLFYVPPSLSLPPPSSASSSSSSSARLYKYNFNSSSPTLTYPPSCSKKLFVSLCSPPSTSTPPLAPVVEQDPPSPDELPVQSDYAASIQSGAGCKACGREEIEKGCNGEGRIQGGIATVPGFGWWPIKAYRPCPGFVASGGRYRRQGQSMDEVAFGRGPTTSPPTPTDSNTNTSSKKQGAKKSKR